MRSIASDFHYWYSDRDRFKLLLRLVLYPLAFALAAVAGWLHRRAQKTALEWPVVEGCVQFVSVDPITDSTCYTATLEYSYFWEEYRSGSYKRIFPSEEDANNFTQIMKDKRIPIHYNPQKPDKSVLEDDDVEQVAQPTPHLG